jgi:hypothetical protein
MPIVFKVGRPDQLAAAQIFGKYDPYRVKHTVEDETHPVFFNVQEQFETMARDIDELEPREAYIKLRRKIFRGSKTVKFRSVRVPKTKASWDQIQRLRDEYARRLLSPIEGAQPGTHVHTIADSTTPTIRRRG